MSGDNQFLKQVKNMLLKSKRSYQEALSFAEAIKDPAIRQDAEQLIREFRAELSKDLHKCTRIRDLFRLDREALEVLAKEVCPAKLWYQLMDTVDETPDEDLIALIIKYRKV